MRALEFFSFYIVFFFGDDLNVFFEILRKFGYSFERFVWYFGRRFRFCSWIEFSLLSVFRIGYARCILESFYRKYYLGVFGWCLWWVALFYLFNISEVFILGWVLDSSFG